MSDSHLPCRAHAIPDHIIPDHAVFLKATAQHGRRETNCSRSASSGYHAEFHEVDIRCRWPVWNQTPFAWTRKRVVAAHYKKGSVGLVVRIFPATMRTFTKDTALSEQGRGAAWHVWINARHGGGRAWARHGNGMLFVNRPYDGWWRLKEAVKFNLRYSPTTLWEKLKKNHENPQLEQPVSKSKFGSRFS